ncbi:hypothetical protein L5F32_03780 [Aliarcobacter butzleri]|uniref:hypothetical protein n=1 Tax=Aliarcobacter butzleri TaxID=28197 RepID=UPI001EDAF324|nr:hypothetical protein [Aliarcobacter butzleri]MCG3651388.1 hypothetical protein [Aliarcobacter butzleri]
MKRGIFNLITEIEAYRETPKDWFITLDHSTVFWYGLLKREGELTTNISFKEYIIDYLKNLKKAVETNLEKRFIYFICSRKKVRFNINKKPFYNPITKNLTIHMIIGKNKKIKVKTKFFDCDFVKYVNPNIKLSEVFISFQKEINNTIIMSIHDFLLEFNINIGIETVIHYVGKTKNPHTRPTNSVHAGLSNVLYNIPTEEEDVFLYFNTFKVITEVENNAYGLNFITTNSLTDEIDVENEADIIEKAFILYFDSEIQYENRIKENKEFKNNLIKLTNNNNIRSLQIFYEMRGTSEYWKFSSSAINKNYRHIFTFKIDNNQLIFEKDSSIYNYYNSRGSLG